MTINQNLYNCTEKNVSSKMTIALFFVPSFFLTATTTSSLYKPPLRPPQNKTYNILKLPSRQHTPYSPRWGREDQGRAPESRCSICSPLKGCGYETK